MGYSNMDIAREVPMDEEAVGPWRRRWHAWRAVPLDQLSATDRLTDAPRPGAVPRLTAEQVCQIVALACEHPTAARRTRTDADDLHRRRYRSAVVRQDLRCLNVRPCARSVSSTESVFPRSSGGAVPDGRSN